MRKVYFFINSLHYTVTGNWRWNLPVEELFCVSMFVSLPANELYARILLAIIDPEHIQGVAKQLLQNESGKVVRPLKIRIITSKGNSAVISLDFIETIVSQSIFEGFEKKGKEHSYRRILLEKENQFFAKNIFSYKMAETMALFGVWYLNLNTMETYYSDNVFRIYGLKPQSLPAAGLNSFVEYIHPEDRLTVLDTFQQAFSGRLSLHLEYRIIRPDGEQRWVNQSTRWNFDARGGRFITGIIQDITDDKNEGKDKEYLEEAGHFNLKLLTMGEEMALLGHWQINLTTRQSFFSDQFYRVLGWKHKTREPGFEDIFSSIHPEDQGKVQTSIEQLFHYNRPLNLECRIISAVGKLRYLKCRSEIVTTLNRDTLVLGLLQDITEPILLHTELQETNAALEKQAFFARTSNEIAGTGIWIRDVETGSISCSESLYYLLGCNYPDKLSPEKLLETVHPEDKNDFLGQLAGFLPGEKEMGFEFRIIKRGEVRWLKAILKCLVMENRKIIFGKFQDISREVTLRKDLIARIHYAGSLGDMINYRIITVDTRYRVLDWNNKSEVAYNRKKTEVLGKNLFEVLPSLKTAVVTDSLKKALQGEEVYLPQIKGIISEGYLEVSEAPLYNEQNKIFGELCLLRNVTETVRLEDQLNQRLSFIERLLESTVDRIAVLDRQMNCLYWNKQAEEHYGLLKTEVLGKNMLQVSSSLKNVPSMYEFRKALKGEKIYIPAEKNNDDTKYEETYIIPITDQKEVTSILWIVHDLTSEYELRDIRQSYTHLIS